MCLCKVFGMDKQDYIPIPLMYMMVQILWYGMDTLLYFALCLAKEIHNGLIGISKGRVDKPFGYYFFLMTVNDLNLCRNEMNEANKRVHK